LHPTGYTPLHFAAEHHAVAVATVLLDAGAAVDALDDSGNTPLWQAVFNANGDGAMIALLRARGADPDHANNHARSPLQLARLIGNRDAAQFFADLPDARTSDQSAPRFPPDPTLGIRDRIEAADGVFLDSTIVSCGFAPFIRDYDVVFEVWAPKPRRTGAGMFCHGRWRYRFTHCPEMHARTRISPETYPEGSVGSWDDVFTDFEAYERAGHPETGGHVWGVGAQVFPGMALVEDSERAAEWSARLERPMHHVAIETDMVEMDIVFHDLRITQLAAGDPVTEELRILEE
jgi:uncharacterized protein